MTDYIDKNDLREYISGYIKSCNGKPTYTDMDAMVGIISLLEQMPAADVLPVRLILQIVQGRLNGVNYTLSEAIKSNDTNTAYKMKGANDICNEILADLKALTAKDSGTE
jgi:hypothetical protein